MLRCDSTGVVEDGRCPFLYHEQELHHDLTAGCLYVCILLSAGTGLSFIINLTSVSESTHFVDQVIHTIDISWL